MREMQRDAEYNYSTLRASPRPTMQPDLTLNSRRPVGIDARQAIRRQGVGVVNGFRKGMREDEASEDDWRTTVDA